MLLTFTSVRAAFAVTASLLALQAAGQEFWLEPARYFLAPGQAVHLRRLVGQELVGRPWPGPSRRVVAFWHGAPGQPCRNLHPTTTAADTLATTFTLPEPGTHVLGLATSEALSTLPAPEFTAYLQQAGLEQVAALRELRGETTQPGREAYRRCAKTLVHVGPTLAPDTSQTWARPLGLPLELVPEQNPYRLPLKAALTVRLLAEGQPVAGQQVLLWRRGARPQALVSKGRSNQNGRVLFRIFEPGEYLISTVRMVAAPPGQESDWQSTWSTLSFAIPRPGRG